MLRKGNLADGAPGKSIGGDIFKNKGNSLPSVRGRIWFETDINDIFGYRGSDRLLYSNDGLIYKSTDHYKIFTKIKQELIMLIKVILNGADFDSVEQLHKVLKEKLELPDYYGENLDALWDCLTGWVELPMTIEIQNVDKFEEKLGSNAIEFIQLLKEANDEIERFVLELK